MDRGDFLKFLGGLGVTALGVKGAAPVIDKLTESAKVPELYKRPRNPDQRALKATLSANFVNSAGKLAIRAEPNVGATEIPQEQLQQLGIDVTGEVDILPVWGWAYPSAGVPGKDSFGQAYRDQNGTWYGKWGEIIDPKGAGAGYIAETFVSYKQPNPTQKTIP